MQSASHIDQALWDRRAIAAAKKAQWNPAWGPEPQAHRQPEQSPPDGSLPSPADRGPEGGSQ